eukprot:TRINITY_DN6286_c0_g1_i1.p1 TRINITY_DN6286_c0_g1~~TRINITY_DN6286_c0_g1_i1.p1  ORF type:complete len:396 (-),score=141.03 TRINITY_DN6286_c0_g1_i1:604-1791(-)
MPDTRRRDDDDSGDHQKLSPSGFKRHQECEQGGKVPTKEEEDLLQLSINNLKTSSPAEPKMGNASVPENGIQSSSLVEEQEDPLIKLQLELSHAKLKLQQKDDKIEELAKVRDKIEAELRDLTASLFEEAHKMVREANVKQASAEKKVTEAQMQMEGLTTEVQALKVMVLTSTPSAPNKHLHPQLDPKKSKSANNGGHFLSNGTSASSCHHRRNDSTTSSSDREDSSPHSMDMSTSDIIPDPTLYSEYLSWKKSPSLHRSSHDFLERLYGEDITLATQFQNPELQEALFKSIKDNTLSIHPIPRPQVLTKECTLLKVPFPCQYRVRIEEGESGKEEVSFDISALARNRIIAVCDALNYLRYVTQGLVKSSDEDVFTEIMGHRRKILLSRLGFKMQ